MQLFVAAPVCGIDGKTYADECHAKCAGVPVAYKGECRESCVCPLVSDQADIVPVGSQ